MKSNTVGETKHKSLKKANVEKKNTCPRYSSTKGEVIETPARTHHARTDSLRPFSPSVHEYANKSNTVREMKHKSLKETNVEKHLSKRNSYVCKATQWGEKKHKSLKETNAEKHLSTILIYQRRSNRNPCPHTSRQNGLTPSVLAFGT